MDLSYRTLCDSPAPTTAVLCNLPFSKAPCIATASETKLQIYTFRDQKLILIWEKNYWAKIIAIFAHHEKKYDCLILVCDVSKVVVLQPVGDVDLQETEFHQFDPEEMESTCIRHPTKAVMDPNGTCIALLIGISTIYFLTLSQPEGFDLSKRPIVKTGQHSKWETINGAVLFNLVKDYKPPIFRVRDIKFLEGYKCPTLAILHEPIPTWSVRLPLQKSTIAISITSPLLIERKTSLVHDQSISWTSRPLPHNAITVIPVWIPHGGFLVLCKNSIIYMTHTSGLAYGLNALARIDDECPFELCDQSVEPHEIFSPAYAIMDATHVLITVDEHHPAILTLHTNGIDVTGLSLFVNNEIEFHPSLFLKYFDNLYFGGSVIEDSILFELSFETEEQQSSFIDTVQLSESQLQLYEMLYDSPPINASRQLTTSLTMNIISKIYQLGTVTCATPFINIYEMALIQGQEDAISMALGCGLKNSGCLQFFRLSLTPKIRHELSISDVISVFASNKFDFILFATQTSTMLYQVYPDFRDDTKNYDEIISASEPTIVGKDFIGAFLQITPTGARLINESQILATWKVPPGKEIKQAIIYNAYAAVVVDQTVYFCDGNDCEVDENHLTNLSFNPITLPKNETTNKPPPISKIAMYGDFLFMLQINSTLLIYSVVSQNIVLAIDQFRYFHDVYYRNIESTTSWIQTINVLDMNIIDIGTMQILTLILKEGNVILYQIAYNEETNDFAFRRIKTRRFTYSSNPNKHGSIVQFYDINGFTGGFICGERPMFLLGESGYPRLIPAPEGLFFTQFKNDFFYGGSKTVKLANFENLLQSEIKTHIIDGCPIQRKMLYQTPRCMAYADPWKALVFFASRPIPFSHENEPDIDAEAHLVPHYQRPPTPARELPEDNYPIAYEEQYTLFVASANGIKEEMELDRHEVGYCVSFLHLSENYQIPKPTLSEFLAIGTGYMCHEERMVRGRMAIYKGILVQSEQQDENEIKLQELYDSTKDQVLQAPVTNICEVDGYIAAFIGTQLQMIMFINQKAIKVASFLNGHFFSNQLLSMKNYLFYVDAYKGFQMIRWRKYGNKLITVAKDFQTFCPLSASLITHNETFGGAVYDCAGNVQLFEIDEYAIPVDAFIIRSVFHIGCRAISAGMFPMMLKNESGANEISGYFGWFVGDKGTIGVFSPIKNDNERRKFCIIQNSYEKTLTGFSHQEYRWGKFPLLKNAELISQSPRLVVDMDLILDLLESHPETQRNCTKMFSRSVSEMLASVAEMYSVSSIFE